MSRHIAGRGRAASVPRSPEVPATPQAPDVPCDMARKLTLGQFLKLASLLDSGAEAKRAVGEGLVRVNGEVDTRRGRGLEIGDVVEVEGRAARVAGADPDPAQGTF